MMTRCYLLLKALGGACVPACPVSAIYPEEDVPAEWEGFIGKNYELSGLEVGMSRYEAALVRAGLIYLVLTGLLGLAFFISPKLVGFLRVTHVHTGLVGFFLSLVMGVAYWLMPRPSGLRQERLEALTFYLLNIGLIACIVTEPYWRMSGLEWLRGVLIASGTLQLGAMLVFALAMHRRVRTKEAILSLRQRS